MSTPTHLLFCFTVISGIFDVTNGLEKKYPGYNGEHLACYYGYCTQFMRNMNCPECGEYVKAMTCHTCVW